jgi:hypothetical protein
MAILKNDIKVYQSQDNTDNDSGGGSRTSVEIVDGAVNNLFPDISRIDTVSGDVALRKIFPTVVTDNRDLYYGAHAIIRKTPVDPNVSALLFHTNDPHDKRVDAQNAIESYVIASYEEEFYLFGNHVAGAKSITWLQRTTSIAPVIGEVYMILDSDGITEQFVRVSSVDSSNITLSHTSSGITTDYTRRRVICEIEQPLILSFTGSNFQPSGREDNGSITYSTQVANASKFYGTKALSEIALSGSQSIKVESIFEQVVPASIKQSPLVNVQALVQGTGLLATGNNLSKVVTTTQPSGSLGFPVTPNSITKLYSSDYIDDGIGNIKQISTGDIKGQIDYKTGDLINLSIPSVTNIIVDFGEALLFDSDILFTKSKLITTGNQGFVYVENLDRIPSSTDLYIDYRSNGKWYRFTSNGDGSLGKDSTIGAGTISDNGDSTATLALTLGALPDIDSTLIISWGSSDVVDTVVSTNASPDIHTRKYMSFDLGQVNIDPASFTMVINRPSDGGSHTVSSNTIGVLSDTAPTDKLLGQLDFINGELIINNTGTFGDRLDPIGSANDVVIDFNYSTAPAGTIGEIKNVIASRTPVGIELPFTSENFNTGALVVDIGESVLIESLSITLFERQFDEYGNTYGVTLVSNSIGELIKAGGNTVYGTVSSAGVINFTFPSGSYLKYGFQLQSGFNSVNRNDTLNQDEMTIKYQTAKDASPAGVHNITDKLENIATYKIRTRPDIVDRVRFNFLTSSNGLYSIGSEIYTDGGLQVGTIDRLSGSIDLIYFDDINDLHLDFELLKTVNPLTGEIISGEIIGEPLSQIAFRTSGNKLTPSSFQVRYETVNGSFTATSDANGVITGTDIDDTLSYVDTQSGAVNLAFTSDAIPSSILYDAVAETSLPLDPELLGLNPVRLPVDGRVPIYDAGRHLVIFNEVTTATTNATPLADDVQTLARSGQGFIEVIDSLGKRLDSVQYVADKDAGTVTFTNPLVLEDKYSVALTAPFSIVDRIEDMFLATDVSITGTISLSGALSNEYPANNSYVASSLVWGDTGARVYNYFSQEIWNNGDPVWQDTLDGDPTTSQFDEINYPIQIDNQGSTSGRWAIIFTNSTTVDVVEEKLGVVESGVSISIDDVAPINPATGTAYFTMDRNGFGSGWVTNNVIRINTDSGDNNMWVIRTVASGALAEATDKIELEIRGDAN